MSHIDFTQAVSADDRAATVLAGARAAAHGRIIALCETAIEAVTGPRPLSERLSWEAKLTEARAVLAGGDSGMIAAEAAETGEEIADLAHLIVARAAQYRLAAARIAGMRRRTERRLATAATPAEVTAALESLKTALSER